MAQFAGDNMGRKTTRRAQKGSACGSFWVERTGSAGVHAQNVFNGDAIASLFRVSLSAVSSACSPGSMPLRAGTQRAECAVSGTSGS